MLFLEIFDGHVSASFVLILSDIVVVRRYAVCSATHWNWLHVLAKRKGLNRARVAALETEIDV